MKSRSEMQTQLLNKVVEDEAFRDKLVSDPRSTIEQEFDLTIPDGVHLHVHEEDRQNVHLVLPPRSRMNKTELSGVAGGSGSWDLYF